MLINVIIGVGQSFIPSVEMKGDKIMSGYTREEVISKAVAASTDMSLFYKKEFINYRGNTTDSNEPYTEVICEWLLNNFELLDQIPHITRNSTYFIKSHDGIPPNIDTTREEELIAMALFRQKSFGSVGEIIDYQTPLKNKREDKAGKIDLLAYDGDRIRILELKEPESKETMLRCILEGYTYLKTVDEHKLKIDFGFSDTANISAHPLVFFGREQHQEMFQNRPHLKKLIKLLDTKPLYVNYLNNEYVIMEG
jgi:hypothetical protein